MSVQLRMYSFGFHRSGPPADAHGNGGFIFDCRALDNPGRQARYRNSTGLDGDVRAYLDADADAATLVAHAVALLLLTVRRHEQRGFTQVYAAFGCTGGQHRSVYCAERAAEALRAQGVDVLLEHTEEALWP